MCLHVLVFVCGRVMLVMCEGVVTGEWGCGSMFTGNCSGACIIDRKFFHRTQPLIYP